MKLRDGVRAVNRMNTNIMAEELDMMNLDLHHELRLDQNMVYQAS